MTAKVQKLTAGQGTTLKDAFKNWGKAGIRAKVILRVLNLNQRYPLEMHELKAYVKAQGWFVTGRKGHERFFESIPANV